MPFFEPTGTHQLLCVYVFEVRASTEYIRICWDPLVKCFIHMGAMTDPHVSCPIHMCDSSEPDADSGFVFYV